MDSTSKESPTMFPFNSAEKADLVVRSFDGVHFFVAKFFLTYNSEFFANLLTDSVPEQTHEGLPMYVASESSPTMCMVLKLCYPCHIVGEDPVDIDFSDVVAWQAIRDALRKYIMEDAETLFMAYVKSGASRMMQTDPQKCFVLARWAGLDDVARAAAKETLRHPFHDREVFEELALVSALEYRRLWDYFRSCGNAVVKSLSPHGLHGVATGSSCSGGCKLSLLVVAQGGVRRRVDHVYLHPWVNNAIQESQRMVREYRSAGFLDEESCDRLFSVASKSCSAQTPEGVRSTLNAINEEVERLVSQVEFAL